MQESIWSDEPDETPNYLCILHSHSIMYSRQIELMQWICNILLTLACFVAVGDSGLHLANSVALTVSER